VLDEINHESPDKKSRILVNPYRYLVRGRGSISGRCEHPKRNPASGEYSEEQQRQCHGQDACENPTICVRLMENAVTN